MLFNPLVNEMQAMTKQNRQLLKEQILAERYILAEESMELFNFKE